MTWVAFVAFWIESIPTSTPPGWPTAVDYPPMLMVPVGAIVLAAATSIPGPVLGLYGGLCVLLFIDPQLSDGRFKLGLTTRADVYRELAKWCGIAVLSWAICRAAIFVRPRTLRG